ncbi:hypothetical protein EK21DRAFT_109256 [Setomelanomma holmii]|uniref:Uncharacterized protein n=1 Tax=Setomelanomma holmii TaxID=210430 RepID=A0A9P4HEM4_9PLEO|nr:hypothetical protein EK21DRAFT_109256 [Setomelanomma holmii]
MPNMLCLCRFFRLCFQRQKKKEGNYELSDLSDLKEEQPIDHAKNTTSDPKLTLTVQVTSVEILPSDCRSKDERPALELTISRSEEPTHIAHTPFTPTIRHVSTTITPRIIALLLGNDEGPWGEVSCGGKCGTWPRLRSSHSNQNISIEALLKDLASADLNDADSEPNQEPEVIHEAQRDLIDSANIETSGHDSPEESDDRDEASDSQHGCEDIHEARTGKLQTHAYDQNAMRIRISPHLHPRFDFEPHSPPPRNNDDTLVESQNTSGWLYTIREELEESAYEDMIGNGAVNWLENRKRARRGARMERARQLLEEIREGRHRGARAERSWRARMVADDGAGLAREVEEESGSADQEDGDEDGVEEDLDGGLEETESLLEEINGSADESLD